MKSLAAGDREALGTLFARHHQNVYALCVRLCGSEAAGEDVTQEVFFRVLKSAASFSAQSRFSTWLYRVARNACLDHHRSDRREFNKRDRFAMEQERSRVNETSDHGDGIERIRLALDKLEPDKREILVLRRFHDLSYSEIADVCSCTVETARVKFHRALQSLRKIYLESSMPQSQTARRNP